MKHGKLMFAGVICLGLTGTLFAQALPQNRSGYCQILDRVEAPAWQADIGYATREEVHGPHHDDLGMFQFNAEGGLGYYRTLAGVFDIRANWEHFALWGDGGIDLPNELGILSMDIKWIRRYESNFGFILEAFPGIYSEWRDLSGNDFFFPFEIAGVQALNDHISLLVGAKIYPGFERGADPHVGARWALDDNWLMDIFYPHGKITYLGIPDWRISAGYSINKWREYQLRDSDKRNRLMYDENRIFAGAERALNDQVYFFARVGRLFDRSVDFDRNAEKHDISDAWFMRVGIGSRL